MAKPIKKEKEVTQEIITNTVEDTTNIISENITENTTENTTKDNIVTESLVEDAAKVLPEYNTNTEFVTTEKPATLKSNNVTVPANETGIDVQALLSTIQSLQKQVDLLTKARTADVKEDSNSSNSSSHVVTQQPYQPQTVVPVPVPVNDNTSETAKLLTYLTNKKSDKEVTIVHNQELTGGLSTAIQLTGLSIDFHTMGEQRVLSYQQFEECVSNYLNWFKKKIILLSYEDRELADKYNIPYVGQDKYLSLTRDALYKSGKLTVEQLQDFYLRLSIEDQKNFCAYWVGKCYERDTDYYNRYKVECLNRLSDNGVFDNILVNMNNEFMKNRNNVANVPVQQGRQIPVIDAVDI